MAVARRVQAALARLGIEARLDAFAPGRANVLARLPGRGERAPLVFSAHMDTLPAGEAGWSFPPFAGDIVGDRVRGRGAADMKGALAAFVAAAGALARRPRPPGGDVILAFTAGESRDALGARRLKAQGALDDIGAFLCGEPSSLDLVVAESAAIWIEAVATGRPGHVSGDPGTNAVERMVDFLTAIRGLDLAAPAHPLLPPPSLSVGRIEGGMAVNLTPDRCRAAIDVRAGPGVTAASVLDRLGARTPEGVSLTILDEKPAVVRDLADPFVQTCGAAAEAVTGRAPGIVGVSYYSDAAILLAGREDVPFAILGPGDIGQSGQPDESVAVEAVRRAAAIYERIALDWLG